MFTFITNIPIFRRLFYAFMLAAVIPGVVIVILGLSFVGRLEARSTATKNITEAAQQARNANTMIETLNSQLNVLYNRQYQSMQPLQAADRTAKIQQIQTEEKALAGILTNYTQNYRLSDSPRMQGVTSTILSDDAVAQKTVDAQRDALNQALTPNTGSWPQYQRLFDTTLNQIQNRSPLAAVSANISIINGANTSSYAAFVNAWSNVIENTEDAENRIANVGSSQTTPIFIVTIIAFFSTIMVVIAIGYFVNLTITRPLRQLATLTTYKGR